MARAGRRAPSAARPRPPRLAWRLRPILPAMLVALLLPSAPSPAATGQDDRPALPCAGRDTALVVRTDEHRLWLCRAGQAVGDHAVSLGKGGTGKSREGDERTPLGTYPLGAPRLSARFHLFIPLGYPTAAQRRQGFTGGAVGIHGPARRFAWAGRLNTLFDWTQGCIAVGTVEAIAEIAAWVEKERPALVHLE